MVRKKVCVIVDGYSSGTFFQPEFRSRGIDCVHIMSEDARNHWFSKGFDPKGYVFAGETSDVDKFDPLCILPGSEPGVELAERLSKRFGLLGNDPASSSLRRNKADMMVAIANHGIPCADHIRTADLSQALKWWRDKKLKTAVVKVLQGAGGELIFICNSELQMKEAFENSLGQKNQEGKSYSEVLVQEFLEGTEYNVSTVSLNREHYVVSMDEATKGLSAAPGLITYLRLLPPEGSVQEVLTKYAFRVLDALGVENGAALTQIILTPNGPRLLEVNARATGAKTPPLVKACTGQNQITLLADIYTNRQAYQESIKKPYRLNRHGGLVPLFNRQDNQILNPALIEKIRELRSFLAIDFRSKPDEPGPKTISLATWAGSVKLCHESSEQVDEDARTIRKLEHLFPSISTPLSAA